MAVASQEKELKNLQDTRIKWVVLLQDEEEFDEAFRIIRQHIEDIKTKQGKYILRFSIERQ